MAGRIIRRLALAVLVGWPVIAAAATPRVGVGSAVDTEATGTAPGEASRRLVIGQDIVHNERIVTDAGGQAQLLFVDESAMTVGPGSDVTIDEFVFDPSTGKGRLAMSATRGVMRFVGGKLSKQENAVAMTTPTGTLGIRGGIFVMDLHAGGALDVVFLYGKGLTVTGADGLSQTITRPGYGVTIAGRGAPPSTPAPAPQIGRMLAQLSGRAGANGGARVVPSEAAVAGSGIANAISNNIAANIRAAAQAQPVAGRAPAINVGAVQNQLQLSTVASQASPQIQQVVANQNVTLPAIVKYTDGAVVTLGSAGTLATQQGFTGTLANGQLTVPAQPPAIPDGGTFPLPVGAGTFGPQPTADGSNQLFGVTLLAADRGAFLAFVTDTGGSTGTSSVSSTFVIGGVPAINMPASGVGNYIGLAVGGVNNNGSSYAAAGGFAATYNFGTNTGSVAFGNFDGRNFGGQVSGSGNAYSGALAGSGLTGQVSGKLFGLRASATGGNFQVGGGGYNAAGVFLGLR